MPESKGRRRPSPLLGDGADGAARRVPRPTPRWWAPAMVTLMVVGLLWIVVFYLSGATQLPVPQLGAWNLGVGFGLIVVGFAMTTRWR